MSDIDDFYPSPTDPDFQLKIYQKREFAINKFPERQNLSNYEEIEEYRNKICTGEKQIREQQAFLGKFINPNTPYKGAIIMHGTGTGKCLTKNQIVKIFIPWNEFYEEMKIESIHKKYSSEFGIIDSDGGVWYEPTDEIFVESYEKTKFGYFKTKKKISKIFKQYVEEEILVIHSNKNKIEVTKAHKFLTRDYGWTNNIFVDDYIGIPDEESINVNWVKIEKIEKKYYCDFVYDLEIEDTHNFVSQGFIVSNTCAGITIAEGFKKLVDQYGTKIHILVGGPLIKENWKNELVKCVGSSYVPEMPKTKMSGSKYKFFKKKVLAIASNYYKFLSHQKFRKKVLGERIQERPVDNDNSQTKKKPIYKKTKDGEFKRSTGSDMIKSINNSLIIVDEAHHMVDNYFGEALHKIIKNSKNLKVVLLTATPMRNLADDLIELLNFVRPIDSPIKREKIFTSKTGHMLELKKGGLEYLKKMATGYISYLKGADPITFAKKVDVGIIPEKLIYTKLVRCFMLDFQKEKYLEVVTSKTDSLDKHSEAIANFIFPTIDINDNIKGVFGKEGLSIIREKVRSDKPRLDAAIFKKFISKEKDGDKKNEENYIDRTETDSITGQILNKKYLKNFSIKFFVMMNELDKLVWNYKGAGLGFIYSNLVRTGIDLIKEVLLVNGYLEYLENANEYKISQNTKCYFCGCEYYKHVQKLSLKNNFVDDTTSLTQGLDITEFKDKEPPAHIFYPATFLTITGKASELDISTIQEEKQKILAEVFSNPKNKDGKFLKLILGSQVMTEGLSLSNVKEVHIVDANFHLGKVDQILGRAIRYCYHHTLMTKKNPYPEVKIFKYVISLNDSDILTTEENLYRKAEKKYHLIKKVERILQEVAIDCPLNRNVNVFKEETEKYKNCNPLDMNNKNQKNVCPAECNFMSCEMKCSGEKLNSLYWDDKNKIYVDVEKKNIDFSTFTKDLIYSEVTHAKEIIKKLYREKVYYTLKEITTAVKESYDKTKKYLYDDYFTFIALDSFILKDENDFNRYMGGLYDKFGRHGYLIHVEDYYIFQSYEYPENAPMYYRENFDNKFLLNSSVNNFIKSTPSLNKLEDTVLINEKKKVVLPTYIFDTEYYENRKEHIYVGIIDAMVQKTKSSKNEDVFKIRERKKESSKKREIGLPTLKGSVCATSKTREYLMNVAKTLKITTKEKNRYRICDLIKNKLMYMEKYIGGKTYLIIPKNHPIHKFPFNLEDRLEKTLSEIFSKTGKISFTKTLIPVVVNGMKANNFSITFNTNSHADILQKAGATKNKNGKWTIMFD